MTDNINEGGDMAFWNEYCPFSLSKAAGGKSTMVHTIGSKMASGIERVVGISLDDIRHGRLDEIHESIERTIGHPLKLGPEVGYCARGNMHIQVGRTISSERIEKQMRKYFG